MATLERIRSNAGLLIGVIAFALFAFIIGDFLKNPSKAGNSGNLLANIDGHKVTLEDYQARVNELTEVYKVNAGQNTLDEKTTDQIYQQVWEALLRDNIMGHEYEELGLAVSEDELESRVIGNNTDPIIRQMFANPNTGQFDKSMVLKYLKMVTNEESSPRKKHWLFYEKTISKNRLNAKYNNLISKGLVVTPKEAELALLGMKSKKSIEYFSKPYSSINDSAITVSKSEIEKFYKKTIERYKQKESRNMEYVTFPIKASASDYKNIEKWINESKEELKNINEIKDIANYIKLNSDDPWTQSYMRKDEVETRYKAFAFDQEVGSIYGSYLDGDTYKVVKLASRTMRSDSVKASHILIKVEKGQDPTAAIALSDSLFEVVKSNPRNFSKVAEQYSQDPGSGSKGGDLGWFKEGMMVKTFSDACFNGNKGDIVKVNSQYGVHIIKIEAKGKPVEKVQLAILTRKVEPSTETYRAVYSEASKFLGTLGSNEDYDKFNELIESDPKLSKTVANNMGKNDKTVNNLTKARSVVKWAYGAKIGEISDIMEIGDIFLIAAVTQISEEGYKAVDDVASIIKPKLLKDKKAAQIIADIESKKGDSQTLSSLAQKMGEPIRNAEGINIDSYHVTGAGVEPALVGAVSMANKGVISNPVKGTNGVYVFRVTSESKEATTPTAEALAKTKTSAYAYRINYQAFTAMRDAAEITDNRYKYY